VIEAQGGLARHFRASNQTLPSRPERTQSRGHVGSTVGANRASRNFAANCLVGTWEGYLPIRTELAVTPEQTTFDSPPHTAIPLDVDDPSRFVRVHVGELPWRYAEPWTGLLVDRVRSGLESQDMTILDVGAGRKPTIPTAWRPPGTQYVGLDIDGGEIAAAAPGSYDEAQVGDIGTRIPDLEDRFDLVFSWFVLEHVANVPAAIENMRSYLKPGGQMVSMLSGTYGLFALLARVIPHSVRVRLLTRYQGVKPEERFATHHHHCTYGGLEDVLRVWSSHEIIPLYRAAGYVSRWRSVERAYLAYEDWLVRRQYVNLAPYYFIHAVR
jgi:SAM-dependent methyltransferase